MFTCVYNYMRKFRTRVGLEVGFGPGLASDLNGNWVGFGWGPGSELGWELGRIWVGSWVGFHDKYV